MAQIGNSSRALLAKEVSFYTAKTKAVADEISVAPSAGHVFSVGSAFIDGIHWIYRTLLFFDTSGLPAHAVISAAKLKLYVTTIFNGTANYDVQILSGMPTYPSDPVVRADWDEDFYLGDGGSLNTANMTASQFNEIDLNDGGIGWINIGGTTKLCLRSSRDINGDPSAAGKIDWISFYTQAQTGPPDYRPVLVVTYSTQNVARAVITCEAIATCRAIIRPDPGTAAASVVGYGLIATAADRVALTFTGDLAPGDQIAVNTETMELTYKPLGGVAVTCPEKWIGEFPLLLPGTNLLQYGDDETTRNLSIRVIHKPRYG